MNIPQINTINYYQKRNYQAFQTKPAITLPQQINTRPQIKFGGSRNLTQVDYSSLYPIESSKVQPKIIWGKIANSDDIVIFTHEFADGDGISSGLALLDTISKHFPDKKVHFLVPHGYPSILNGLPGIEKIEKDTSKIDKIGLAINVDCGEDNLDGIDLYNQAPSKITFDHHGFKPANNLYNMTMPEPSTTQLLYRHFFKPLDIELSTQTGENLLSGLITDTGFFHYIKDGDFSKITKDELLLRYAPYGEFSLRSVDDKMEKNAIYSQELLDLSKTLKKCAEMSDTTMTSNGHKVNYFAVTPEVIEQFNVKDSWPDIKCIISKVNKSILNYSDCGLSFWDLGDGRVKVSMRSIKDINLIDFSQNFGGNGHDHAAGFTIKKPLQEAVQTVLSEIQKAKL